MTLLDEIILPAKIAPVEHRSGRRLALAETRGILEMDDRFIELLPWPDALEPVSAGLVPLLLEHHEVRDGFRIDRQIGAVREAVFEDGGIKMVVEFNFNARGEWIWESLAAGFVFGCSVNASHPVYEAVELSLTSKPYTKARCWLLRELTILPAQGGRVRTAKVRRAANMGELMAEMAARRVVLAEMQARRLPDYIAAPLRDRVPQITAAVMLAGGDQAAVEAAIGAEVEAFIQNYRDPGDTLSESGVGATEARPG